ncbi:hypothetical protein P1P75_33440 [Streptomyces sp. ID05-39B]|uniref:hypothetical protein n=1 Tax=Streptomyces sp. ID05-39B TaxID=3028664 RepID=UPI0029A3340E|nr:hypothetical protein [Streptomyces sp. ID05-39B]MDX3531178.1 hypothetical protein [Streptomyces sp. ID05-39B]
MAPYRKKPVQIEAHQWNQNGDHPEDGPGDREGRLVRYFRRSEPEYEGTKTHALCGRTWHDHGWIDTLEGGNDGAQVVCPGDWIVTGVQGEHYPVKPDIFAATYEPAAPIPAAAEAETTARVFAALHGSAEEGVTRVISLYEQWVKAGPPPLGTPISRWWDKRLVELHHAILPAVREQRNRPTHPDGTPYSYAEITAEGWEFCDGCRTWSTATAAHPHQCPETHISGPITGGA